MEIEAQAQVFSMGHVEENQCDDSAFEAIVTQHQSPLLRYARRLVRNDESAQDVVQETFVRYLDSARKGRPPGHPNNWLFRVTHNLCVDLIRKERRMQANCESMELPEVAPAAPVALETADRRRAIDSMMEKLTENQRTVLVLKIEEGKSYREISEITGLTVSNVGFLIHRALKKMAELVRQEETIQ